MKKYISNNKLLILFTASFLVTVLVVLLRFYKETCCACAPTTYQFGSIIYVLLNNYFFQFVDCQDCRLLGCAYTSYVIPVETLLLTLISGSLLARKLLR